MKKPTFAIILLSLLALPGAARAAVYTFTGGAITITDVSQANPYPATLLVSGIPLNEPVVDVNITINGITHAIIDDVGAVVGSPAGQFVVIFDGAGMESSVINQVWIFDDQAALPIPIDSDTVSGTWQPSDEYGSEFPVPVPSGPRPTTLSTFNNANPNGTWVLYVADFTAEDAGTIGSWSITFTTVPEPGAAMLCGALAAAAGMRRRR